MPVFPADLVFDVHVVSYLDAVIFVAILSREERLFFRALVKNCPFSGRRSAQTHIQRFLILCWHSTQVLTAVLCCKSREISSAFNKGYLMHSQHIWVFVPLCYTTDKVLPVSQDVEINLKLLNLGTVG